jgi:hypothetical protein
MILAEFEVNGQRFALTRYETVKALLDARDPKPTVSEVLSAMPNERRKVILVNAINTNNNESNRNTIYPYNPATFKVVKQIGLLRGVGKKTVDEFIETLEGLR